MERALPPGDHAGRWFSTLRLPRGSSAVWLLNIAIAVAALCLYAFVVDPSASTSDAPQIPWWLLAAMFAVTEVLVVHVRLGREALTVSMSEIPLVIALFSSSPAELITAQLVGSAVVLLLVRRQPAVKLGFNLASYALESCVAIAVFQAIGSGADSREVVGIAAAFAAAVSFALVGALCVFAAVSVSSRQVHAGVLVRGLIAGTAVAIASACLGVVVAEDLLTNVPSSWLLIMPVVLLYATDRAYMLHRERGTKLAAINEASQMLQSSLDLEPALVTLVEQARSIFGGELAVAVAAQADGRRLLARIDPSGPAYVGPVRKDPLQAWWAKQGRTSVLMTPKHRRRLDPEGTLASLGIGDAIIVPIRGEANGAGILLVGNPVGDVGAFDTSDVKLLETLANHAGVTFDNARLVGRLHEVLHRQARNIRRRKVAEARVRRTDERFRRAVLAMSDARNPDVVPGTVVEAARDLVSADFVALTISAPDTGQEVAISLLDPAIASRFGLPASGAGFDDVTDAALLTDPSARVRVLEAPVVTEGAQAGALLVANIDGVRGFSKDDRAIVNGLAAQASVAIENATVLARERDQAHELDRINAELRYAYDAKSAFLASISHELRVPLSSILIAAEVLDELQDGATAKGVTSLTSKIKASGRHVLALFDDLLDLSRIESGHLDLRSQPMPLSMLLHEAVDSVEPVAAGEGVGLELVTSSQDPVIVDPLRIRQVLLNLITNAVKFTPQGGRIVVSDRWADETVSVMVADNGPGIAPRDVERIFEPFERALPGTEGAGLGLAISRKIAELHGGTLEVESVPGDGSTFTLTLPRRGNVATRGGASPSVLVVEGVDDAEGASRVSDMLSEHGLDAIAVSTTDEALASLREATPNLVIVDLASDRDVRLDAVREIRDDPSYLDIPVLALVDGDEGPDIEIAIAAGCDDAAPMPAGGRTLAGRVRRILEREIAVPPHIG